MRVPSSLSASVLVVAACAASGHGASLPGTSKRQVSNGGFTIKAAGSASKGHVNAAVAGAATSTTNNTLLDSQDIIYMADITVGGQAFTVQFDTGSTDLWVFAPGVNINTVNTTNITATETYGIGTTTGTIQFAEVQLGGYTVPSQAFINAASADGFAPFPFNGVGILGMSFDDAALSPVNAELEKAFGADSTLGRSTIANIFFQSPDTPNSFDVALDRASDLDDTSSGTFLIGEHAAGFESVTSQPQLPRLFPGRWTAGLQGMNVLGQSVPIPPSAVSGAPEGQLVMLLDTGFSLPPIPPSMVDAIYSSIPGAINVSDVPNVQWLVPCDAATNVTFNFGGIDYPIHPLDLTIVDLFTATDVDGNENNVTVCFNAFQYFTFDGGLEGFDGAMGDSFLRNVYASFDFGSVGDASGNSSFMQLLPTTNPDEAWPDFVTSRHATLAALPPALDPAIVLQIINGAPYNATGSSNSTASTSTLVASASAATAIPSSSADPNTNAYSNPKKPTTSNQDFGAAGAVEDSTPSSSSDSDVKLTSLVEKYGPVIIGLLAGNLIIGLVLCIIGIATCLRSVVKSGAKSRSINPTYAPVRFKEAEADAEREAYHD